MAVQVLPAILWCTVHMTHVTILMLHITVSLVVFVAILWQYLSLPQKG